MRALLRCAAFAPLAFLWAAEAHAQPSACPGPTLTPAAPPPVTWSWMDVSASPDVRADRLLSAMTLEEKVDMATGEYCLLYGFYNAPIARLGIPALTMTDGPAGIRIPYQRVNDGRATLLPAPIALAATWDPDLAAAQGDVLGSEAFSTGHNVLLGPTLDLARLPLAGRNFETFGEDPLLASRLAVPMIQAIQRYPVLATAKHYSTYTQETDRFTVDERVDERPLHELYLRPFESAVRDGHVAAAMCGFNRVNGVYACEDHALLTDVLEGELGFDGYVMSDWGGAHTTIGAATAGLDQELAFGKYFGRALFDAVQAGEVAAPVVDAKARRIVKSMLRAGLFDQPVALAPLPDREHGQRSREIAEQGIVLLENAGGLLPLDTAAIHSIAVLGADASNASTEGGGAARVEPTYAVSPLDGIRQRAGGGIRVDYAAGTDPITAAHLLPGLAPIPSSVLSPPGSSEHGLQADYWSNTRFDGDPDIRRVDAQVAVSLGFFSYQSVNASSVPQSLMQYTLSKFSARWTGTLTAPATGDFQFSLTTRGRGWLWIDGNLVIDDSVSHDLGSKAATVHLGAGERHAIRVDYAADADAIGTETDVGGDVMLGWKAPAGAVFPSVRDAARAAAADDVAIVVVRDYGTEERDRLQLALPGDQEQLVREVAAANPRTIVVLMTGQPVDMPWLDSVAAVVEAWYPGQEQGNAIARVLFGDVNPSGKLPITFPRALADTPGASEGIALDAIGPVLSFAEGGLIGYRWYDARNIGPLFPFGHGLSYTTFGYDGAELTSSVGADGWRIGFTITNTGTRDGTEVAQVYVGACSGDAGAAPKQLAGFTKVPLRAGESKRVSVDLDPRSLSTWSVTTHWQPVSCAPTVYVASSSRDVRLTAGGAGSSSGTPPGSGSSGDGSPGGGPSTGGSRGGCSQGGNGWLGALLGLALLLVLSRRRKHPLFRCLGRAGSRLGPAPRGPHPGSGHLVPRRRRTSSLQAGSSPSRCELPHNGHVLRRIVPGLFLVALLVVFQLAVSIDWPPDGSFALARPHVASGDEPHYLLITNSLLRDGDLQLQNDYWRAALGSGEAGEVWNGTLLDHHTFIVNPETNQSWLWQAVYDWTRPVICYPGTCMGYAPLAGVTPPSTAGTIEAPAHPVAFPAAVAAVLTAFRPGPADTEALSLRVAALFSWLAIVVMYLTARRAGLTVPWSLAAVALVGVASSFFPYARSFFAETSIALALVAGLYALQADRPAIPGVCIACAMFLKPPFAVIALGWIAERIWARRPRSAAALVAVVGVAALGLVGFDWWLARKPVIGGAGVVQLVAGLGNLWWMFLHPHAGLLVFVPWAVIPMLAPFFLRPRLEPPADREAMLLRQVALGATPYLCVLLVLADFTGYSYGPRYLVALLPMLGLAAIVLAHRHRGLRVPLVVLGVLAALVAVPAAARYPYLFSTTPLQILAPPIPPWAR